MSNSIYGIDLGTTNSCIGIATGSEVYFYKNKDQVEITPSVVYIAKSGRIIVGQRALSKIQDYPDSVAMEFKRIMGFENQHIFESGHVLSPEELSSEILKSLIEDVKRIHEVEVRSAVIAVPASFGTLQCEATTRAAQMAGIEEVVLIQEPIAAAIAYGIKNEGKNEYILVYDLGGGTLDIAVVSTGGNNFKVLAHKGNNFLGGKDFDKLIVDYILLPSLQEKYEMPSPDYQPDIFHSTYKKLLKIAEQVKWELTTKQETEAALEDLGEDLLGNEIESVITINQVEFEELINPTIEKTLKLADEALRQARISSNQLQKIILVGGPTQIPYIRQKLHEHFQVIIDTSLDPITAVTRGTALYASTLKARETSKNSEELYDVNLEYETSVSSQTTVIAGRIDTNNNIFQISTFIEGKISGSWVNVERNSGFFEIEITLSPDQSNQFHLVGRDTKGDFIPLSHDPLIIEHRSWSVANPPLPHSISIEWQTNVNGHPQTLLQPFIRSGTPLPALSTQTFKAAKTLRQNDYGNSLVFKIWEGECFEDPDANTWIGNIHLYAETLSRPIPEGHEIEITLSINQSRLIAVEIHIPNLGVHLTDQLYISEYIQDPLKKKDELVSQIEDYYSRLHKLSKHAANLEDELLALQVERVFQEVEDFDITYEKQKQHDKADVDSFAKLLEESKRIRKEIVELETKITPPRFKKVELEQFRKIDSLENLVQSTIHEHGNEEDHKRYQFLKKQAEILLSIKDNKGIERIANEYKDLRWNVISRKPEFWIGFFEDLIKKDFNDEKLAEALISQGKKAIQEADEQAIERICLSLFKLIRPEEAELIKARALPPGVKR